MWFLLRLTFWLGVILVLLPSGGTQPVPPSQVSAGDALSAAKTAVSDMQHFCERQRDACTVGSQVATTLGQRAQAGAKILYDFLSEQFAEDRSQMRATGSVAPPARPSQHTLGQTDLTPTWRGPQP
jgi:Family of unknown function (DUF5330)